MRLTDYLEDDRRLKVVKRLARSLYNKKDLEIHNYGHALWVTDKIINIVEEEGHPDISLPIAAGLMHDTGVAIGEYELHPQNSARIVREYFPRIGFSRNETEEIAIAVQEHKGLSHTSDTSRMLYDADTLNKAGFHGIYQCMGIGREFGLEPVQLVERLSKKFEVLHEKGYYTDTAASIDRMMGIGQYGGLEFTSIHWNLVDELLRQKE